jgi:hypothetical protein
MGLFLLKSGSISLTGGRIEKLNKTFLSQSVPLSDLTYPSQVQSKKYTQGTVSRDCFLLKHNSIF